jgi:hypothetical protein
MESNDREHLSDSELDDLLNAWEIDAPPERLSAAVFPERKRPGRFRALAWMAAAAACLLAAILAGGHSKWTRERGVTVSGPEPFIEIPYTVPLGRDERATVVRMNVSVAELLADGFEFSAADAGQLVSAEVIVGEDGRAHAIRLVAMRGAGNMGGAQ